MKYNFRYLSRIAIEAETPLAVGGGDKGLTIDRPIAKDANGLPYIPGTSLAGVLRHSIYTYAQGETIQKLNDIFGFQSENAQEKSPGSRLSISSAHLMGKQGKVFDGLLVIPKDDINYDFINQYQNLPVRQHVHINHKGAADIDNYGKFDEEVLYKGTRLIFEIEMKGTSDKEEDDKDKWEQILNIFSHPDFRIGGGSTKGFGRIRVIKITDKILNLGEDDDRKFYLKHSVCLDDKFTGNKFDVNPDKKSSYISYQLHLIPEDFYLFSSGLKSDTADMNPVMEQIVEWDEKDEPTFSEEQILIPATSVKGAISHRVAYHYNKLDKKFADELMENGISLSDYVGEKNKAVKALFGLASDYSNKEPGKKGAVLFSDVYRKVSRYKKLDHVAIDRFTGGAIDGALFNENVVNDNTEFILELRVNPGFNANHKFGENGAGEKDIILKAFEETLTDICSGSLPLGGGTMRGNGVFTGTL